MPQQPHVYMDINTTVRNMGIECNQQRPIDMDINSTKKLWALSKINRGPLTHRRGISYQISLTFTCLEQSDATLS